MSGELERRWDDAVETAWREFRERLADRLAELEGPLLVEVPEDDDGGVAPYCQVLAAAGRLHVEAVSNHFLAVNHLLSDAEREMLRGLGFSEPSYDEVRDPADESSNFWIDLEQREADRAAVMMVRALREVYAVVHPVYLQADGLEPRGAGRPLPPRPRPDEPVRPEGADQVRTAVDLAVRVLLAETPEWDEDGDLPLETARGVVWVTVSEASPRMLLHSPLVDDVVDESRALVEMNLLNRREFGLTFSLRDSRIQVMRELDVAVLIPSQVRLEIERLTSQVDGWASDLVARVGGRCMDESAPRQPQGCADAAPEGRFEAALAVLHELEKQERGSVDPATMARVFHQDTELVMKAIRHTQARLRNWQRRERKHVANGNHTSARRARARQAHHRDLRARMRRALRLLLDAPVRKVQVDQPTLFDEDECGSGR